MADIDRVADQALDTGLTVAVAESLTCGLLASTIGKAHDAGTWFAGGVIAYQTPTKESVLGLAEGTDPVSPESAEQLARGVRTLMDADVAVSVTGVGGPGSEGGHAAGTVYVGWCADGTTGNRLLTLSGEPEEILEASVEAAVAALLDLTSR
ncbi:CinA family protein [Microbacterium sp. DT81.1]|uniref:CinA family protein n=1 Tax=Microbacterium sp. DT81.1 TaxID=3393413 RepID=UPI003CE70BC9